MVPDMPNSEDAACRGATAMRQVGFEVNGPASNKPSPGLGEKN